MKTEAIQEPITGSESREGYSAPQQALVDFYDAFNGRNIVKMRGNWHSSGNIAMDNPLGGIKRGWEEIEPVYEKIFNGMVCVYVEFYDYTIDESPDTFLAIGRERGTFEKNGEAITLAIRTSRVFRKVDGVWRQVHHHGSIEDPALLERYQRAVKG